MWLARSSSTKSTRPRLAVPVFEFTCVCPREDSGDSDGKPAAFCHFALAGDGSSQMPGQSPGDCQPQPEAFGAVALFIVDLEEFFEKHPLVVGRDSDSRVRDM